MSVAASKSLAVTAEPESRAGLGFDEAVPDSDPSERIAAEAGRAQASRRGSFPLELERSLRQLSSPLAIVSAAQRMLGQHLGANRVGYGEVDRAEARYFTTERNWTDGSVGPHEGTHDLEAFGPDILRALRGGEMVVVHDARGDPRTAAPDRSPLFRTSRPPRASWPPS